MKNKNLISNIIMGVAIFAISTGGVIFVVAAQNNNSDVSSSSSSIAVSSSSSEITSAVSSQNSSSISAVISDSSSVSQSDTAEPVIQNSVPVAVPEPPTAPVVEPAEPEVLTATIAINCQTALAHTDKLNEGQMSYMPADGIILNDIEIEFTAGETAFDVLKRACEIAEIQLEYAFTPVYNSHYIEGLNHLYEFDCGSASGWLYRINGWTPDYGVSAATLTNGDYISFDYTCDYGKDI